MLVIRLTLYKAEYIPNNKMSIVITRPSSTMICQQKFVKYKRYKQYASMIGKITVSECFGTLNLLIH